MAPNLKPKPLACTRPSQETLADQFGLDEAEVNTRYAFTAVEQVGGAEIAEVHELLDSHIPAITDAFYWHLKGFPELKPFLADDDKIKQLTVTMQAYLLGLGHGIGSASYIDERLRIGIVHERIGLGPTWYLGAHALLSDALMKCLDEGCAGDTAKLARVAATVSKLLFFDASLGIHAYHQTSVTALEETLEKAERAEAELKRLSSLDGLTGTLNRRALMASIETEQERFRRYGHEFTVLFLDFDHFKSINDNHGHGFGDQVLVESVSLIQDSIRSIDVIGRYGGEELVVMLVECGQDMGGIIAERIRASIAGHPFRKRKTEKPISVTVSIGLHTPTRRNTKPETILRHADRALYTAKDAGRNCVVAYTPDMKR
jgi:diguanylate cyclase (GGDEF)-like protein